MVLKMLDNIEKKKTKNKVFNKNKYCIKHTIKNNRTIKKIQIKTLEQ